MKKVYLVIIIFLVGLIFYIQREVTQTVSPDIFDLNTNINSMQLTSPDFENGQPIPSKYTCDGQNINPSLEINTVPEDAAGLVLLMDDPDAVKPAGKVWDHWVVFNIPPALTKITAGQQPEGVQGIGTGGNTVYSGPCPPDGEHRYYFKLYALDTKLDLPAGVTKAEVLAAMTDHILAETELIGTYNRQ